MLQRNTRLIAVVVLVTAWVATSILSDADASNAPYLYSLGTLYGTTAGGTSVILYGQDFTGTTSVKFGGSPATIISVSASEVDVTTPAHSSGAVDVVLTTPKGKTTIGSNDIFTFTTRPHVTDVEPDGGPVSGGTAVQIYGGAFTGVTSVKFGTTTATALTVVSDTEIDVTAPAHTNGITDVTATRDGLTSPLSSADQFTYDSSPYFYDLSVNTGPTSGGTTVQIFGAHFTGTTAVHFGSASAAITSVTDSEVDVVSPAASNGTVDVTVTTPYGTTAINVSDAFTYSDLPTILSAGPYSGPSVGGTPVQLTGFNLAGVTSVRFGSAAAYIASKSATSATVVSPAHPLGAVNITATSAKGTSAISNADYFLYTDAPTVGCGEGQCTSPSQGPTVGGTRVEIFGTNLNGTTAVHFGSASATNVTNVSASEVDATSPAGSGPVNITVTTAAGTSDVDSQDIFTYSDLPYIYDTYPDDGSTSGGTVVQLAGTNFTGATAVTFGGVAGTDLQVQDDGDLTVTTPAHSSGVVRIAVTTPKGTSVPQASYYDDDTFSFGLPPTITQLSAEQGPTAGGEELEISGVNLAAATAVYFGSTQATILSVSDGEVDVTVPALTAGVMDVTVVTPSGTTPATPYTVFTATDAPSITQVTVDGNSGFDEQGDVAGGDSVQILGYNLAGATSVHFGTTSAKITSKSASEVDVTSPAHAAGTVDITVTTAHGTSAIGSSDEFTYIDFPEIFGVSPAVGPTSGGTSVVISGSHLTGATSVLFGDVAATSYTVVSDSEIDAVSPAHVAAIENIEVATPTGTTDLDSADQFAFSSAPIVTQLVQQYGPVAGGTVVQIDGSNLGAATAVKFGSVPAASFTIVSGSEIDAVAPAHSGGAVHVQVTNAYGTSVIGSDVFTFDSRPVVLDLGSSGGPTAGGQTLQIYGSNLTGATKVSIGSASVTTLTVVSDREVDVVVPKVTSTSTVTVRVTTPYGTSALGDNTYYTYSDAPMVDGLSTGYGSKAGGTAVAVYGSNLSGATSVKFGGSSATGLTVVSATEVDVTSPAHSTGLVHVTVTTPKGTSVINGNDLFQFGSSDGVALARAGASKGSSKGNTVVRVYGRGLGTATSADFGDTAAIRLIHVSPTEIDLISPPHASGPLTIALYHNARRVAQLKFTYV